MFLGVGFQQSLAAVADCVQFRSDLVAFLPERLSKLLRFDLRLRECLLLFGTSACQVVVFGLDCSLRGLQTLR